MTVIVSLLLSVVMALMNPLKTMASNTDSAVYISEFKVGMGKKADEAKNALEGYTIITDTNGNYVDFNDNAGGGLGSKGDRVVYIGYKTTANSANAITDIALMNMKGGYKTDDYDALMDKYINSQIIPFVDSFMAAIREYRENYNSPYPANKERAQYLHDALNKFTDDDCDDAPLGDLLLNQTKYEMGDAAYNALSDSEKKKHADLVTIIAQSNGVATMMIENLLVRAADTAENSWIERLSETTYDDLLESTGLSLTKAQQELDKKYYDDAMKILEIWGTFKKQLEGYDEALTILEELKNKDHSALNAIIENYDIETADEEQSVAYGEALAEINIDSQKMNNAYADVMCKELLENTEYDGGTLLDLFLTDPEEIEEDPTIIYPLVASLSNGQRAGIEFLTLEDLVMIGATDGNGYKSAAYDELEVTSIYEDVNREIYQPGGVGLTSDAIRTRALENLSTESRGVLSTATYVMLGLSAVSIAGFGVSIGMAVNATRAARSAVETYSTTLTRLAAEVKRAKGFLDIRWISYKTAMNNTTMTGAYQARNLAYNMEKLTQAKEGLEKAVIEQYTYETSTGPNYIARAEARSTTCSNFAKGMTAAMIIIVAITTYLTWRDLKNHYKVDYTPIPRYMVDEKDITAYNEKGEKIVIKNQEAYYTAVTCNRDSSAEYYKVANDIADLNGDVGQQWLAMYCAKNSAEAPILAASLKVVKDNSQVPSGYKTGAHMFGTESAENFNNIMYIWNSNAKSIYLYYKTEEVKDPSLAGTGFTAGTIAISAGAGLAVGALASAFAVTSLNKRKRKKEEAE